MLKLPVTEKTFKKGFLGGQGEFELTGTTGLAAALTPEKPFPEKARTLVAVKAGGSTPQLKFGNETIACTASFSAGADLALTLARAGDGTTLPAGAAALAPDRLGVLLALGAHANAQAGAAVAAPAGFSFGLSAKAGTAVTFERYLEFGRETPARSILDAVLSDLRLPQSRSSVSDLPLPGEVVQFSYAGFLELAAALNWGYSMTGSEGFTVRDIQAKLDYALRAKAFLTLNYRLAGDFAIALTRGHADGWARLTVRKRRDSQFQAAAGFDFTAKADLSGLPETPNEFLAAFLGADARTALDVLDKAVNATDVEALEKLAGKLLSGVVTDLAERWTGGILDSAQLGTFLANLRKAIGAYKSIDERLVDTVMELYEKTLGPNKAALEHALAIVSKLSGPQDLVALTDQGAWNLIQQIVGGDVFKLIAGDSLAVFADLQAVVAGVLKMVIAPDFDKLRDLVAALKSRLKLDELFGKLEKVSTAKDLRDLRDKTLQGLVERVVGKVFDEIKESELGSVVGELNKTVKQLKSFKDAFAEKMQKALHQSVELRINYLYTRATADSTLIDVEIDVRAAEGEALFRDAAAGRVRAVFAAATVGTGIRVHEALLTHEVTRSSQLQVNVFGWEFKRLVEVVTHTDISLQAHAGGLVQVFTTAATLKEIEESGRKHKERMQANFLLRMAGETFGSPSDAKSRDFIIRTLERMSVSYDLVNSDDMTDIKELTEYLSLGRRLGLVPDGLVPELESQFGKRLGRVQATYTVRFDHKAVHDAFVALTGKDLDAVVRSAGRSLVAAAMVTRKSLDLAAVGLAYRHGTGLLEKNRNNTLDSQALTVTLPGWLVGGAGAKTTIQRDDLGMKLLRTLFNIEDDLAERFVTLDAVVDDARMKQRSVAVEELEKAADQVLRQGAQMDKFGAPNTFFGIFDALVRIGGLGKAHRESALVLEITPPGGEKVTKFFMDSPAVTVEAEVNP
jgi:hypothetical protein